MRQSGYGMDLLGKVIEATKKVYFTTFTMLKMGIETTEIAYLKMKLYRQELIKYLDYYNNLRIRAKFKDLQPTAHR